MNGNRARDNQNSLGEYEDAIRRHIDGSIDFRYYQQSAHHLRSAKAWDIIRAMGQILPFHRDRDESLHLEKSGCTIM